MKTLLFLLLPVLCLGQNTVDRAKTLYDAKKYDEARKLLTTVDDDHKDFAAAQYYLGRIAFDQKDFDTAEDHFEEAIDANDKVADYHLWMGNVIGSLIQDANPIKQGVLAPKIKDAYEKAVGLNPDLTEARWGLISFYTEAPGFMGGSFEKAYAQADLIKKKNEADGYRAYGQIYNKEEKPAEAEKSYLLAYKANPKYIGVVTNFYINSKQYDKLFSFLDEALKAKPGNNLIEYQVGRACAISGQQLDRGEQLLNKYLSYQPLPDEPGHAGAQMRLGQIYEKKGNKAEAKKRYEAALKLDPSQKDAKEGLTRVSK